MRWTVVLMLVSGAFAAVTSFAWPGLASCVVVTICAAAIGARISRPSRARSSHLRTTVVLGALAYLIGMPVTWLVARHVEALDAPHSAMMWTRVTVGVLLLLFAATFYAETGRSSRG